ncbi:MotA/TolQ/ExbB proton channel family protein [Massilia timonae]|uniref:MotA/TolQ/ExbB proton channel family protein n=2 Tax=Massilia timonae TaxID=47229 RepID=UPI0028A0301F|nr:MotA/TolQ/ExbB proton channel family protein [Massilia timonae]
MNVQLDWETGTNILTIVFVAILVWIYATARRALHSGNKSNFVEYAPSLLTSLGIFGTFLGIVIGLWNFDPQHIDTSIQQLLAGLKTAFVTSIVGILGSILVKSEESNLADRTHVSEKSETIPKAVGPDQIYEVLNKQLSSVQALESAIGGSSERSMVGQLQLLRTEVIDFSKTSAARSERFQEELWTRLNSFAEIMSKSATEQVIEALKQVIVEFNQRLTEQFGDNFKRLDESVKKLVDWQAQYMEQLEEMGRQYSAGVSAIESTNTAVQSIRSETARIPSDMQQLAGVLQVNQHQIQELGRHLSAFVDVRDKAVEAVPQIQARLEEVGQQLHDGATKVNTVLIQGSNQFMDSVQQTNQSMIEAGKNVASQAEVISKELQDAMGLLAANTERIRAGITATVSSVMETVEATAEKAAHTTAQAITVTNTKLDESLKSALNSLGNVRAAHERALEAMSASIMQNTSATLSGVEKAAQQAVDRTNASINTQLNQLDEGLSRQLNAALTELGSALGSIANHLVEHYNRRAPTSAQLATN